MKLTREIAQKVVSVVDAGLVAGVGVAEPGKMCVEAAVCYALGEPHGDRPSCVGEAVRAFKIRLNDARWSSNNARSNGLRAIAVAQLGSNEVDQVEFVKRVVLAIVKEILPPVLRRRGLKKQAIACEASTNLASARIAATAAAAAAPTAPRLVAAADAVAYAAADAAVAYAAASAAADAFAYAAADAAVAYAAASAARAAASSAASAAADAAADAYAAADAADVAADAADAAADAVLRRVAAIGVRVLIELKSPGTAYLDLVDA